MLEEEKEKQSQITLLKSLFISEMVEEFEGSSMFSFSDTVLILKLNQPVIFSLL